MSSSEPISEPDFLQATDPWSLFVEWYSAAVAREINDPNAMSLATVDMDGFPNVRIVLLKGHDERGFVFYTNYESQKGTELLGQGKAALNFHWKSLGRQLRVRGLVEQVSSDEADEYYNSRPLGSRIGAWASQQSRPLSSRQELVDRVAHYEALYDENPPRPSHWSGFRVVPSSIEFWENGDFRLHNRMRFVRASADQKWSIERLYP